MLKTTTTTEKGKTLKLWLDENSKGIRGTVVGLTENEEIEKRKSGGTNALNVAKLIIPKQEKKLMLL